MCVLVGVGPGEAFPDSSVSRESTGNAGDPGSIPGLGRFTRLPTPIFLGFPCGSAKEPGKESDCNVGDLGSIPGLGRSPGEGKGYPLQYSGLENSMDYKLDTTLCVCVCVCVCVYWITLLYA